MLETLELGLFAMATMIYVFAWLWHLRGWKQQSAKNTRFAIQVLAVGWILHLLMVGLRWYRADFGGGDYRSLPGRGREVFLELRWAPNPP